VILHVDLKNYFLNLPWLNVLTALSQGIRDTGQHSPKEVNMIQIIPSIADNAIHQIYLVELIYLIVESFVRFNFTGS